MIKRLIAGLTCLLMLLSTASGIAAAQSSVTPDTGVYAAMGDSIAAGAGLAVLSNATDQDTACARSSQGYPNIVAQQTGLRLINASCGGATVGDVITQQMDTAFSAGKPELITITAGANDVHWVSFLRICRVSNCATDSARKTAMGLITVMQLELAFALQDISVRSNGEPPKVILTGYYNPISNYCKGRQTLVSNQEIDFLNMQRDALNKAIRDVVSQYSFASYASTNFTGHAVCAPEPWIQGFNDPAPLHPTARGQQHIAEAVSTMR